MHLQDQKLEEMKKIISKNRKLNESAPTSSSGKGKDSPRNILICKSIKGQLNVLVHRVTWVKYILHQKFDEVYEIVSSNVVFRVCVCSTHCTHLHPKTEFTLGLGLCVSRKKPKTKSFVPTSVVTNCYAARTIGRIVAICWWQCCTVNCFACVLH